MNVHIVLVASLLCGGVSLAWSQRSDPAVAVPTVTTAGPRAGDTTNDLVFVVRDLDAPNRPLQESLVAVGKPGTAGRAHPMRTLMTRADGTARTTGLGPANLDVVVLSDGYEAV